MPLKVGQTVMVCYDGKQSRGIPGIILAKRKGYKIKVKFIEWGGDKIERILWFKLKGVRENRGFYGWVIADNTLMNRLFKGLPGDYYTVVYENPELIQ